MLEKYELAYYEQHDFRKKAERVASQNKVTPASFPSITVH